MKKDKKKKSQNLSIIDSDLCIEGTISSTGNLVVKGRLQGTLEGESIVVAEEGVVVAEARVSSMTIGGVFEGEINSCDDLVILSTGSCAGKVECRNLTVESGGILNATVSYLNDNQNTKKNRKKIGKSQDLKEKK